MNQTVSIIIPVYNAEKYIKECVDSVLNQTYSDIEVILVDDGSLDACPGICDEYAERDNRVRVVHQINGGASSARNAGLELASGSYLCFVDSDDIVPNNGINLLVHAVNDSGVQYAAGICGIMENKKVKNPIEKSITIDFTQSPERLLTYITQPGSYSPYAKIFLTRIIQTQKIKFDEQLKCSEDALFIRQYLKYCEKIRLIAAKVYLYNADNDNSLSKKRHEDFCLYFAKKMNALEELVNILPLSQKGKEAFIIKRAIHGLRISANHYFTHWKDTHERKKHITRSIVALEPWLIKQSCEKSPDLSQYEICLLKLIQEKRNNKIYSMLKTEYYKRTIRLKTAKIIKGLIKT